MYQALQVIENLIAENPEIEGAEAKELLKRVFKIAHEALLEEDSRIDRELGTL